MKVFSVEEANALLPTVRRILEALQPVYRSVRSFEEEAKYAAEGAEHGGGGMPDGPAYMAAFAKLSELTNQLDSLGVQLKDYQRGLIDFPSLRDGRVVLLCWEFTDGDEIEWWHDVEAGYAGRQPL